ncbi:MAG TPA: methionyl-tRNA formyltransferase [Rhodocyclaceae bacterium]|jgi:methionyl-tRNA formyltransferase|nr:methionyl-tRNA formyltransferase [Rhodocyclaceae bacterium]
MNLIFAGTPEFAAAALEALIAAGHTIKLVLTQPDRPAGRGMQLQASAVKQVAVRHNLPVYQPEKLRDPATHEPIRAEQADCMVVAAYGLILPQAVLDIPRMGCLNIHASLLPRWRGAAPIHRAIEAGDAKTGITIMQMDAGLDTGAMLLKAEMEIAADDTTASLHDKLAAQGANLIVAALAQYAELTPIAQPEAGMTYAAKISKAEARIDWQLSAEQLERRIRAFDPFPGAVTELNGSTIKIWRAEIVDVHGQPGEVLLADGQQVLVACGQQALSLQVLQKPGSKRLSVGEFQRSNPLNKGDLLS